MPLTHSDTSNNSISEKILNHLKDFDFKDWVLGITLLSYITGFIITNLFLGSLGFVNLDLLRVRYILTGIFFLFFLSLIFYPLYGLITLLIEKKYDSPSSMIINILWYTVNVYAPIFMIVSVLGIFAGSTSNSLIGFPGHPTPSPLSEWLKESPRIIFDASIKLTILSIGILVMMFLFVLLVILVFNPKDKDGNRETRIKHIQDIYSSFNIHSIKKFLKILLRLLIFLFAFFTAMSLLTFLVSNQTMVFSNSGILLSICWTRFLLSVFLLYAFYAIFIILFFTFPRRSKESDNGPNDDLYTHAHHNVYALFLIAIILSITLPVYTTAVYPLIPQQLGGGKVLNVQVITSNENLKPIFEDSTNEIFIVDKTTKSTIFLLNNIRNHSQSVVEINNSEIEGIKHSKITLP